MKKMNMVKQKWWIMRYPTISLTNKTNSWRLRAKFSMLECRYSAVGKSGNKGRKILFLNLAYLNNRTSYLTKTLSKCRFLWCSISEGESWRILKGSSRYAKKFLWNFKLCLNPLTAERRTSCTFFSKIHTLTGIKSFSFLKTFEIHSRSNTKNSLNSQTMLMSSRWHYTSHISRMKKNQSFYQFYHL